MSRQNALLTEEDIRLLRRLNYLLEEVLETLEVLADEELMEALKEAEEDVRAGRVRDYEEFIKELRQAGEI
ncbi:MAG TPA: hypothetical protein ENF34_03770 [Candidatus Bathyarchaeota archaeon]|nr:MAG: hypothetical protein DRO60_04355 [Candidatus Bathyarchaeota archaeon]HDJ26413.1 hypothetical protein [Candidatus Bathyarchaeota archaeon]